MVDEALRACEIGLAVCLLQAGTEQLRGTLREESFGAARLVMGAWLLTGVATPIALLATCALWVASLAYHAGPYNGGADRLGVLMTICLAIAAWVPVGAAKELALGYLGVQVVLSYFVAGWAKAVNPDWWRGVALREVFAFSVYPATASLRGFAAWPATLRVAAWAVILFELAFPLALLSHATLIAALAAGAAFHLANALCFGLNRFLPTWLATYPALIWLQGRLFGE